MRDRVGVVRGRVGYGSEGFTGGGGDGAGRRAVSIRGYYIIVDEGRAAKFTKSLKTAGLCLFTSENFTDKRFPFISTV